MSGLSRRAFLKTSAAITAVGAAAQPAALAQAALASPNERIGLAVFGCRNQGTNVAGNMLSTGQFEVIAMCDCDSEMSAKGIERLKDHSPAPTF